VAVDVPHFDLPFRFDHGAAAVNEQDSLDDIAVCVEAIVRYEQGQRPELPEFGIPDYTFRQGDFDTDDLQDAIEVWEERADLLIEDDYDRFDELVQLVEIRVSGGE
jgi:hypothetical protein